MITYKTSKEVGGACSYNLVEQFSVLGGGGGGGGGIPDQLIIDYMKKLQYNLLQIV